MIEIRFHLFNHCELKIYKKKNQNKLLLIKVYNMVDHDFV